MGLFSSIFDSNNESSPVTPVVTGGGIASAGARFGNFLKSSSEDGSLQDALGFAGSGLVISGSAQAGLPVSPEITRSASDFLRNKSEPGFIVNEDARRQFQDYVTSRESDQLAKAQAENAIADLEAQRAVLEQLKNEAIRKAGAGAAAGYNAAIRKIDNELAKLRLGLTNLDKLFARKEKNINTIFGEAETNLKGVSDPSVARVEEINNETRKKLQENRTDAERQMHDFAKLIGAGEDTAIQLSDHVREIEDSIMREDKLDGEFTAKMLKNAENLAILTAREAGAKNILELKRKQIMVESNIKEQINNLIEQRKVLVAQRNAAVSSARRAAAAEFPDNFPLDPKSFGGFAASRYVDKELADLPLSVKDSVDTIIASLIQAGVDPAELHRGVKLTGDAGIRFFMERGFKPEAAQQIVSLIHDSDLSQGNLLKRVIPNAVEIYTRSPEVYNKIAQKNPFDTPPDSVERMIAIVGFSHRLGLSDQEATFAARNPVWLTATNPPPELRGLFR